MRLTVYYNSAWVPVDLDTKNSDNGVSLNWAFDSLENPTDYISEYGYTLTAPYTDNNRKLFNNIQRFDTEVQSATFDPRNKYQYRLCDAKGELVSQGLCYLQAANRDGYVLDMSGTLYDIFLKALNSGWNDDGTPDYYTLIDYLSGKDTSINKELVRVSWCLYNPLLSLSSLIATQNTLTQQYYWLTGSNNTQLYICNIFGFAPTAQGKYSEFSSNKMVNLNDNTMKSVKDIPTVAVEAELTERQTLQFKSYEQQPYIYVWRLWEMYAAEFQAITGYNLTLDSRWFDTSNTLLTECIYMLPKFINKERGVIVATTPSGAYQNQTNKAFYTPAQLSSAGGKYSGWNTGTYSVGSYTAGMHRLKVRYNIGYTGVASAMSSYSNLYIVSNPYCPYLLTLTVQTTARTYTKKIAMWFLPDLTDSQGEYLYTFSNFIQNNAQTEVFQLSANGYEFSIRRFTPTGKGWRDIALSTSTEMVTDFYIYENTTSVSISAYLTSYNGTHTSTGDGNTPFVTVNGSGDAFDLVKSTGTTAAQGIYWSEYTGTPPDFHIYIYAQRYAISPNRSQWKFTMSDVFKEKPFNILLKYSKMMNLLWIPDETAKTMTVIHRDDYLMDCYGNGLITDLTDNVDVSQEWRTRPTSWQDRTVIIGYGDDEEYYASAYKEKYGRSYGSKTIHTGNKTNANVQELLNTSDSNTILPAIMTAEYVQQCNTLKSVVQSTRDFPLLANYDGDGNSADDGGKFLFRQRNSGQTWNNTLLDQWGFDKVYITDDTPLELDADEYCWLWNPHSYSAYALGLIARPSIDTVTSDNLSIMFAQAQEAYIPDNGSTPTYLYAKCWDKYITDTYDVDSRTLQCKAWLNSIKYKALKNSPYVLINSQLYLCNKVEGFKGGWTLCTLDMRRVHNIIPQPIPPIPPTPFKTPIFYASLIQTLTPEIAWETGGTGTYSSSSITATADGAYLSGNGSRIMWNCHCPANTDLTFSCWIKRTGGAGVNYSFGTAMENDPRYTGLQVVKYNNNKLMQEYLYFVAGGALPITDNTFVFITWSIKYNGGQNYTTTFYSNGFKIYESTFNQTQWLGMSGTRFAISHGNGNSMTGYYQHYSCYPLLTDDEVLTLYNNGGLPPA